MNYKRMMNRISSSINRLINEAIDDEESQDDLIGIVGAEKRRIGGSEGGDLTADEIRADDDLGDVRYGDIADTTGRGALGAMSRKQIGASATSGSDIEDAQNKAKAKVVAQAAEEVIGTIVLRDAAQEMGVLGNSDVDEVIDGAMGYDIWEKAGGENDNDWFITFPAFTLSTPSMAESGNEKEFVPIKMKNKVNVPSDLAKQLPYPGVFDDDAQSSLGVWGYINKTDHKMIIPHYNSVTPMYGDKLTPRSCMIKVKTNDGQYCIGYISSDDQIILDPNEGNIHGYQMIGGFGWTTKSEDALPDQKYTPSVH